MVTDSDEVANVPTPALRLAGACGTPSMLKVTVPAGVPAPHVVDGRVAVGSPAGVTLTIEPGTTVLMRVNSGLDVGLGGPGTLIADGLGLSRGDRVLAVVPMFHANAWGLPHGAALAGADLILPNRFLAAEALAGLIASERPTLMGCVPTIFADLLRYADAHPEVDLSSLTKATCGGSAVPKALMQDFAQDRTGSDRRTRCRPWHRPPQVAGVVGNRCIPVLPDVTHDFRAEQRQHRQNLHRRPRDWVKHGDHPSHLAACDADAKGDQTCWMRPATHRSSIRSR